MNTLKSFVVLAVLGVIGYAVYLGLGGQLNVSLTPPDPGDPSVANAWGASPENSPNGPEVNLGESAGDVPGDHPSSLALHSSAGDAAAAPGPYGASASELPLPGSGPMSPGGPDSGSSAAPATYQAAESGTSLPGPDGAPLTADLTSDHASPSDVAGPSPSEAAPPAYPQQPPAADSAYAQEGTAALRRLTEEELVSQPITKAETLSRAFEKNLQEMNNKIQSGKPQDALLALSIMYADSQLSAANRQKLQSVLDQVAGTVIYSRQHLMEPAYVVKPNESLDSIASQHKVPPGLLAKINGLTPEAPLAAGTRLKVVHGPFNAVIDLMTSELTLFVRSRYAGRFPVRIGPQFPSNVERLTVISKTRQHSQYDGEAWIGLAPVGAPAVTGGATSSLSPQIGIVGMEDVSAVDRGPSPQNIAVSPRDADDLFDILSQGSTVTILRETATAARSDGTPTR
ncbi:MAG: LysM domain-containing protein [Planctomycetota bacterium]|nr:MAG: LysM domain-containing protein [Planctomycetota bacterium]